MNWKPSKEDVQSCYGSEGKLIADYCRYCGQRIGLGVGMTNWVDHAYKCMLEQIEMMRLQWAFGGLGED